MTDLAKIQKEILLLPFLRNEFPVGCQLGLPQLDIIRDEICLEYFPHRIITAENEVHLFKPSYWLKVLFPSLRIVEFVNLIYAETKEHNWTENAPLVVDAERFYEDTTSLYQRCAIVIDEWSNDHNNSIISEYDTYFRKRTFEMGVSKIYDFDRT